ncbi:MFS transporter-like protein [Phyllosticta citricarpa]|uniref:MFS transporter-like protein n=2 Tax=Phyllosticta TaxID=121621 RepID=A0ABR1NBQ4_9PEZI
MAEGSRSSGWWTSVKQTVLQSHESPPWLLRYRSSSAFICGSVAMAVFTDIFLYAVIVPVMPFALTVRVGISPDSIQHWNSILIAVYGGALVVASPICGWLADRSTSRRLPLLAGLLVLAGSTVMLNVGKTIGIFMGGRVLQGFSAAVVWVVGLALIVDTVGKQDTASAMGYVSLAMSLGILLAPLLGGVVYDRAGYNAVFAMTYGIIGLDIVLRLVLVEKKIAKKWESQSSSEIAELSIAEQGGGYGATAATAPIEVAEPEDEKKDSDSITGGPSRRNVSCQDPEKAAADDNARPQSPSTTADNAAGAALTPQRTAVSSRRPLPARICQKLPPTFTLLTSPRLLAALLAALTMSILFGSLDAVLPLYTRETFHFSSIGAGLIFLPIVIPSFLAPIFGWVADHTSPRYPTALGFVVAAPIMACLRYVYHNSLHQKVLMCALLALFGVALAAISPAVMAEICYVVAAREQKKPGIFGPKGAYAQAYGLFNVAWALGALIGPIWAGDVKDDAGWGTVWWSLAVLSVATAVPVALWCGGWIGDERARKREEREQRLRQQQQQQQQQPGTQEGQQQDVLQG